MAETNSPIPWNTAVWTFSDATGTPLTYTFILDGGSVTVDEGKRGTAWLEDNTGLRIGVADAGPTKYAQVKFAGKLRDVSKHATDVSLYDVLAQSGVVGSTWVSTFDTVSGARKRFNLIATIPDRVLPSGTVKGGVWTWPDCDAMDGWAIAGSRDGGFVASFTMESTDMAATITRNA